MTASDQEVKSTSLTVAVTVIEKVEGEITSELTKAQFRMSELMVAAENLVVNDAETETAATSIAVEAKTILKALEGKQEETAGILGKWARKLNAHFKPTADTLDAIVKKCGAKVGAHKNALEMARQSEIRANAAKIAAEEKRLEAEKQDAAKKFFADQQVAKAFDDPELAHNAAVEFQATMAKTNALVPEVVEKKTAVAGGSASLKATPRYEITDENLLPREFLVADEKKIAAQVKAGVEEIPGVRIWQEMGFGRVNVKKEGW